MISRKKITAFASLAILLGFVWFHGIPVGSGDVHSMMAYYDTDQLVKEADLVIVGTVLNDRTVASPSDTYPGVQLTELGSLQVLKDIPSKQGGFTLGEASTIEVRAMGNGEVVKNGLRYDMNSNNSAKFATGDRVMLFLEYDVGNDNGDGYYILNGALGKYTVTDGETAKNPDPDRNVSVSDIRSKISSLR